jgi:hypothetical protein
MFNGKVNNLGKSKCSSISSYVSDHRVCYGVHDLPKIRPIVNAIEMVAI